MVTMIGGIDLEFQITETTMDSPSAGLVLADELPDGRLRARGARTWRTNPGATARKERAMQHWDPPGRRGQQRRPAATVAYEARSTGAPAAVGGGDAAAGLRQRSVPPVEAEAHELFRRAIVDGDQASWATLCTLYCGLVRAWVRRHPALALAGETDDYLVNCTFERFWLYVGPDRFDTFAGLPALLQYLKLCAHSVLLDEVRSRGRQQSDYALGQEQPATVEDDVVGQVTADELWWAISAEMQDEAERLVASLSFIHGLKPREIHERHPEHFADIAAVYRVKRNLLDRLRRSETIRRSCD
jgi:DNA-directed RNA polymerase specialized sigma24 family protein